MTSDLMPRLAEPAVQFTSRHLLGLHGLPRPNNVLKILPEQLG